MSAYSDAETSVHGGEPVECYEFVGSYKTYRYTSNDVAVVVGGNNYVPVPIQRGELKIGISDQDDISLEIELPVTNALIKEYGLQITPPTLSLNIYRVHRGTDFATDFVTYWKGRVATISITDNIAKVIVPSIFGDALGGSLPSVYYQGPCNHALFDQGCKIGRGVNMVTTTVVAVSGNNVVLASVGAFPDGSFNIGEIADVAHNDRRMILNHAGTTVTVNYPFTTLKVGATVEVTRGCDHGHTSDCLTKYNNQINFGGFPFIPTINPFTDGL